MGGSSSGRHSGAPVIEHGLKIDLRWLRKQRMFRPGFWHGWTTLSWSGGARIDVLCFDGSNAEFPVFRLKYRVNGQLIEEAIRCNGFRSHLAVTAGISSVRARDGTVSAFIYRQVELRISVH